MAKTNGPGKNSSQKDSTPAKEVKAKSTTPHAEKPEDKKPKAKFPRKITHIVIHCSAGNGDLASVLAYHKNVHKWNSPGYHRWVDFDGSTTEVHPIEKPSNGVKGFNATLINICWRGGVIVKKVGQRVLYDAVDNRTAAQKEGIIKEINEVLAELVEKGHPVEDIKIWGHRDFSPDKNGNGVIEPWERIKACPSFSAIPEYENVIQNFLSS